MRKTSEILTQLAEHQRNNDYEGFKELFYSLNNDELTKLNTFAIELKNSCENRISKQI